MLDLNLGVVPADPASNSMAMAGEKLPEPLANRPVESPGSFASSILNVVAGDGACPRGDDVLAYDFGLLDRIGSHCASDSKTVEIFDSEGDGDRTMQLFPAAAVGGGGFGPGDFSGSWSRRQRLDLTCPEGAHAKETPQPPQLQRSSVKKSRRGPRSRSSQYRGVTFYRRTSRWESHIWLVFISVSRFRLNKRHKTCFGWLKLRGGMESFFLTHDNAILIPI